MCDGEKDVVEREILAPSLKPILGIRFRVPTPHYTTSIERHQTLGKITQGSHV